MIMIIITKINIMIITNIMIMTMITKLTIIINIIIKFMVIRMIIATGILMIITIKNSKDNNNLKKHMI